MKFSRIDHIALDVADLESSIAFYSRHFGFKRYYDQTTPAGLKIGYLELGPTVLELAGRRSEQGMGGFHFCLITELTAEMLAAGTIVTGVLTFLLSHPQRT
jgi:lactoylglutathione lyase